MTLLTSSTATVKSTINTTIEQLIRQQQQQQQQQQQHSSHYNQQADRHVNNNNLNRIKNKFIDGSFLLPHRNAKNTNNSNANRHVALSQHSTAIISPKDLFKSPSQQLKIKFKSNEEEETPVTGRTSTVCKTRPLPNTNSSVLAARSVYELKIKNLNNENNKNLSLRKNNYATQNKTKLFSITPPDQETKGGNHERPKWIKWSTSGVQYEPNENLMQEAQRRLSYNVSIGNQQQSKHQQQQQQLAQNQYQSERQKILNRTSNCYEQSSRLSQMINPVKFPVTEDFDSEVLDINVDDINYEDDDIFGDEDEEQPQQPAQHYHQQQQHYQQNPNKKHIQLDLTVHKQVKSSSESSASTSTSSISAMSNTHAHTHIHTQTNNCNRPTYLKHLKQNDTTTDNTKQNNSNATTTTNNNNHQQQQQSASVSPFTASNSSSSISYASNQHSQIKKFKYPIPPPPPIISTSPKPPDHHSGNIYVVKKSSNQLSTDAASIVVTNKTEFKFLQPSLSPSYSSSSSPSHSSASQPPSPQQQQQLPILSQTILPTPADIALPTLIEPKAYPLMASLANFSHFDIQSVLFNYESVKQTKDTLHKSINTRTGASAASRQSSFENLNKTLPATHNIHLLNSKLNEADCKQRKKSTNHPDLTNNNSSSIINNKRLSSSLFVYLNEDEASKMKRLSDGLSGSDLVDECEPFFRLELGGDTFKGLGLVDDVSQRRMMKLNSISCLDKITMNYKKDIVDLIESNNNEPFTIEFQDYGAYFYRYYFNNYEHANYVGVDANIGPVAISIRRDKIYSGPLGGSPKAPQNTLNPLLLNNINNDVPFNYAYRFIFRTSGLNILRGTILEENIYSKNSATSFGTKHGIAHKEVLGFLLPELDLSCLRLGDSKLNEKLMKLDEQSINKTHKIGVLLCKAGQSTEEEMYNNKESTPAFDEFLQLLGEKVTLKGFPNYRGVLDTTNDTTGTHSVYTRFRDKEVMFHVSTLLPYSANDKQQLTRKRHIGNDLVTIVFQEPGSLPFSPRTIRSHFQHIFIVVRAYNPNSINTQYSVAISYSKDVPSFGPPLPKNPLFYKSKEFRDFLLAKIVNADNAGLKCDKFTQIRMRAQHGILKEFSQLYSTKLTLDNCGFSGQSHGVMSKFGIFNFGSIKLKKTRSKSVHSYNNSMILNSGDENFLFQLNGALFWTLEQIKDSEYSSLNQNSYSFNSCYFGISKQYVVAVDAKRKSVIFSVGCNAIIGWTVNEIDRDLILYYDQGEYVCMKFKARYDMGQCVKRLEYFTKGCSSVELSLEKKDYGQLGFSIHHDGVVTEVEPYSLAYYRGLKQGTRIVKIGDYFVINLNHEKMIEILRKSTCLKVVFLAPNDDGTARRGQDDSYSLYSYLSTCSSLNERLIDSFRTTPPPIQTYNYFDTAYKPLLLHQDSPSTQMRRFSNFSHPKKSAQNRLSSTSATIYNYNINSTNNNNSNNNNIIHSNGSAFTNSYYSSSCGSSENKEQNNLNKPSNTEQELIATLKQHDKMPEKLAGSTSSTSSNCRLRSQNTNMEWANLVKTASKAFENAHKSIESSSGSTDLSYKSPASNDYLFTNEIVNSNDFQKYCLLNKEKKISIEELKDTFIQLQLELNQEKLEKKLTSSKIADILEENMTLKQQLMRLKDENDLLKHQNKPVLKHSDI